LVNQVDTNGNKLPTLVNLSRAWTSQGLTTVYTNRNGKQITTTRTIGNNPSQIETTTDAALGTFIATTLFNSDGTLRQAQQSVGGLDSTDPIRPSSSTVSLAYDAFGRQIRDSQLATLDGQAGTEFKMEYAWHNSGSLNKIVRKIGDDRVTETAFGVDGNGNVTSILDNLRNDTAAKSYWVNDDPGDSRLITLHYNIDSSIADLTRYSGSDAFWRGNHRARKATRDEQADAVESGSVDRWVQIFPSARACA